MDERSFENESDFDAFLIERYEAGEEVVITTSETMGRTKLSKRAYITDWTFKNPLLKVALATA